MVNSEYKIDKSKLLSLDEQIPWETNQYLAMSYNIPIEIVRKRRAELQKHNRHDIDDLELGRQEW